MTSSTFIHHRKCAPPQVIGVEFDCGTAQDANSIAEELRLEGGLVRVDGTWLKWTWGAE